MDEIPQKTIDDAMKFIIEYYETYPSGHYLTSHSLVYNRICDQVDAPHLISVLEGREYISYSVSRYIDEPHIQLLPKGKSYLEDQRDLRESESKSSFRFWVALIKDIVVFLAGAFLEGKFGFIQNLFNLS